MQTVCAVWSGVIWPFSSFICLGLSCLYSYNLESVDFRFVFMVCFARNTPGYVVAFYVYPLVVCLYIKYFIRKASSKRAKCNSEETFPLVAQLHCARSVMYIHLFYSQM